MRDSSPDTLLSRARRETARDAPADFTAGVLAALHRGGNPWQRDWRGFLLRWVPAGLLLVIALALFVIMQPHGEHGGTAQTSAARP